MRKAIIFIFILTCSVARAQDQVSYVSSQQRDMDEDELTDPYLYMLMSMPLNTYANPFEEASRYGFSAVRYNRRGYDYGFSRFNIGGIELNDAIENRVYWDLVRGLGDYMDMSLESFGVSERGTRSQSFGSRTEYDLWGSSIISRKRIGYIMTSRNFRYGLNIKYSGASEQSGYYYSATASARVGCDSHIKGLERKDFRFNALVGRKWDDDRREANIYVSAAPLEKVLRSAATSECFKLTGDNLYNPSWGYCDGQVRGAKTIKDFVPIAGLRYKYTPNSMFVVECDLAAIVGQTSYTRVGWNGVANPLPDYERYMPSWFVGQGVEGLVEDGWRCQDEAFTQIPWDDLAQSNRGDGVSPSSYYLESDVRNIRNVQAAVSARRAYDNGLILRGGVSANISTSRYFKRLEDDLDGGFVYDTDPFVAFSNDYKHLFSNNINDVGRQIAIGDEFGYNYSIDNTKLSGWLGFRLDKLGYSLYSDIDFSYNSYGRIGHYAKQLYEQSVSQGASKRLNFQQFNLVAGATVKLGRNAQLLSQIVVGARPPSVDDMFFDVRYSEYMPQNVASTRYDNFELAYRYTGDIDVFASIYGTRTRGESQIHRYYDDLREEYVHAAFSCVASDYVGVELGARVPLADDLSLLMAAAWSQNTYADDISAEVQSFLSGETLSRNTICRVDGLRLGGSPQLVSNASLKYEGRGMFNVSLGASLLGENYISPSVVRRYDRMIASVTSPESRAALLSQEKFPLALTADFSLSKTFRIADHFLSLYFMVNNIFDNTSIVYSGYEQNRLKEVGSGINSAWAVTDSKYYYSHGRTFYMSINFKL